jgi:prepilin-type N-terminal cleavage/methylation domain-containing protein
MNRSFPLAELPMFNVPPSARTRHPRPRHAGAFTLIELLIVVSIIAVLAGLTLGAMGFVNRKGAESRARTEVAALAAAIESYKLDLGNYPPSAKLYAELTAGKGAVNTNKVYFEPPPGMVNTNSKQPTLQDPYGQNYNYNPVNPKRNVGFFDLWSVPPQARGEQDWIHN